MTELKLKFTKGVVKRAAAIAMAVCMGVTLLPADVFATVTTQDKEASKASGEYSPYGVHGVEVTGGEVEVGNELDLKIVVDTLDESIADKNVTIKKVSGDGDVDITSGSTKVKGKTKGSVTLEITVNGNEAYMPQSQVARVTITVKSSSGTTDPGTTDPSKPGPTDPGTTDPSKPGPTDPGTTDPSKPGTTKPEKPAKKIIVTQSGSNQKVSGTLNVKAGKAYTFKAVLTPSDSTSKVTWKLDKSKNAKITKKTGKTTKITVKKGKKVKVTVKAGSKSTSFTLKATNKAVKTKKIKLNKKKVTLKLNKKKNKTVQLTATVTPAVVDKPGIKWTSSKKKVATVSSSGKVTAKKVGTTKITATAKDNKKAKATVTITVKKK